MKDDIWRNSQASADETTPSKSPMTYQDDLGITDRPLELSSESNFKMQAAQRCEYKLHPKMRTEL